MSRRPQRHFKFSSRALCLALGRASTARHRLGGGIVDAAALLLTIAGPASTYSLASGLSPLIPTLPAAARPDREVFTIMHTVGGTFADLAIAPDGERAQKALPHSWPRVIAAESLDLSWSQ